MNGFDLMDTIEANIRKELDAKPECMFYPSLAGHLLGTLGCILNKVCVNNPELFERFKKEYGS